MKINKIIVISVMILFTSCGRYKSYPQVEKITLVTETTVVTEAVTEIKDTDIVYYTKTGERYHYENPCGKGTYYECTLEEALAKGLTPCGRCTE